jgi:hypothetical protein
MAAKDKERYEKAMEIYRQTGVGPGAKRPNVGSARPAQAVEDDDDDDEDD